MKKPNNWKIFFVLLVFFSGTSLAAAKVTKWQVMLERNGVPQTYWQKYLPKVSRKEYRKAVKKYQDSQNTSDSGENGGSSENDGGIKIIEGKYPLPDDSGKIAREQHLWLKKNQSASSHYEMSGTPNSCRNGMAGGYGAFGPLSKSDRKEEKYYVTMRWGYANWTEPDSKLGKDVSKSSKSITLESAKDFTRSGFVKIDDEYIRYSSKQGDKLKGLKRGYKGGAHSHGEDSKVSLVYKYKGGKWQNVTRALDADKSKKNWYKGEKVLVTNRRNGKKVVAAILESGPAIWTGRVGGLSPEAFSAIDARTNENCTFQYVDEDTELGEAK